MPVEIIDATGKLLQIKIRGKLKKADYRDRKGSHRARGKSPGARDS